MSEIITLLDAIGLPYAYDHFAEGETHVYPCICYRILGDDPFYADGIRYYCTSRVYFELYNLKKDPLTEKTVENVLDGNDIAFNKSEEEYLEIYDAYRISYSFMMEV